jgi:hypothetical protein
VRTPQMPHNRTAVSSQATCPALQGLSAAEMAQLPAADDSFFSFLYRVPCTRTSKHKYGVLCSVNRGVWSTLPASKRYPISRERSATFGAAYKQYSHRLFVAVLIIIASSAPALRMRCSGCVQTHNNHLG